MRSWSLALAFACSSLACATDDAVGGGDSGASGDDGAHDSSGSMGATTSAGGLDTAGAESDSGQSDGDDGAPPVAPSPSPGCGGRTLAAGSYTAIELEHGGVARNYNLFVPDAHDGETPIPLVFNLHGFTSEPTEQAFFSQMDTTAAARGFAVAYPAGIENSWNGGTCCGEAAAQEIDDVAFVRAVAEAVSLSLCVDTRRIFSTGMSNGGFLSHRLACEASDLFAAVAPVAGVLGIPPEECAPDRAVPMLQIHGTEDSLVPYDGGGISGNGSVRETVEGWVQRNGCAPEPVVTFSVDDVVCETWSGCGDEGHVGLCTVEGAGHCWPGQSFCPFGTSTTTIHASETIADFFEAHAMP